jgi:hypothetical protein
MKRSPYLPLSLLLFTLVILLQLLIHRPRPLIWFITLAMIPVAAGLDLLVAQFERPLKRFHINHAANFSIWLVLGTAIYHLLEPSRQNLRAALETIGLLIFAFCFCYITERFGGIVLWKRQAAEPRGFEVVDPKPPPSDENKTAEGPGRGSFYL